MFLIRRLRFYETSATVNFTKTWLFNLAGGISWNVSENNLAGTLVLRQCKAELINLFLVAFLSLFNLDNCRRNLAKTLVGQTDNRNVLDF